MVQFILTEAERGRYTNLLAIDYSKAFDKVDINVALRKLLDLHVRPELLPWLSDFLSNRQQCVRLGQTTSDWTGTTCGVPQGTKGGPSCLPGDGEWMSPHDLPFSLEICRRHYHWRVPPKQGTRSSQHPASCNERYLFSGLMHDHYVSGQSTNVLCCRSGLAGIHHHHWISPPIDSTWPTLPA